MTDNATDRLEELKDLPRLIECWIEDGVTCELAEWAVAEIKRLRKQAKEFAHTMFFSGALGLDPDTKEYFHEGNGERIGIFSDD